jgi:hypothetical protein
MLHASFYFIQGTGGDLHVPVTPSACQQSEGHLEEDSYQSYVPGCWTWLKVLFCRIIPEIAPEALDSLSIVRVNADVNDMV